MCVSSAYRDSVDGSDCVRMLVWMVVIVVRMLVWMVVIVVRMLVWMVVIVVRMLVWMVVIVLGCWCGWQ